MDEAAVKEYLMEHDESFRKLVEEHQDYERQLKELVTKPFLSTQEQILETELKKKKLVLKDQMQLLIERHQAQHSAG